MTVEDHPKYPEWRQALDRLHLAAQRFDEAIANKRPDEVNAAERHLERARAAYDKIASEID